MSTDWTHTLTHTLSSHDCLSRITSPSPFKKWIWNAKNWSWINTLCDAWLQVSGVAFGEMLRWVEKLICSGGVNQNTGVMFHHCWALKRRWNGPPAAWERERERGRQRRILHYWVWVRIWKEGGAKLHLISWFSFLFWCSTCCLVLILDFNDTIWYTLATLDELAIYLNAIRETWGRLLVSLASVNITWTLFWEVHRFVGSILTKSHNAPWYADVQTTYPSRNKTSIIYYHSIFREYDTIFETGRLATNYTELA